MAYEKRVCVLRQLKKGFTADGGALSGAIYCERIGNELIVTPRMLGIAPVKEGRYALAVWADGKIFCLELRGSEALKIQDAPSIKDGFAVLVCYVRGDAEPIAFGTCGLAPLNHELLLKAVASEGTGKKKKLPNPLSPFESPAPVAPNVPIAPGVPVPNRDPKEDAKDASPFREEVGYDDEAIAAVDYYLKTDEDEDARGSGAQKEGKDAGGDDTPKDETLTRFPRGDLTYYKSVKERLDKAFKQFPKDERLKRIFPQSEWVLSGGALLGVIYESGQPRYLCVAVEKKGDAPAEMGENFVFVPASYYTDEEGFYVVFQDADTGEYVTINNS